MSEEAGSGDAAMGVPLPGSSIKVETGLGFGMGR